MSETIFNEQGCPNCQSNNIKSINWTWWGGVIFPRMFNHTKCNDCSFLYNGKSRKSNKNIVRGFTIASIISTLVTIAIFSRMRNKF